jgi:hypothetical protein
MSVETEVFRISPQVGKYYKTAIYTRSVGMWPNEKFYTTNPVRYVGKLVENCTRGLGDGAEHWSIFDDNGTIHRVDYTYEGTTSFVEVSEVVRIC